MLSDLKTQHKRRIVISKNNELEAIIVPIHEYETMAEALALLEHIRSPSGRRTQAKRYGKRITLEALLKEQEAWKSWQSASEKTWRSIERRSDEF